MNTRKTLLTTGAIAAFSMSLAFGLEPNQSSQQHSQSSPSSSSSSSQQHQMEFGSPPDSRSQSEKKSKASEIKGKQLSTQQGEDLGKIEDVAVNLQTGELSYLLVSEQGGSQLKPVPTDSVQVRDSGSQMELVVNIDQQKWQSVPSISESEVAQLEQRSSEIQQAFQSGQSSGGIYGSPSQDRQSSQSHQSSSQSTQFGQSSEQQSALDRLQEKGTESMDEAREFGARQSEKAKDEASRLSGQAKESLGMGQTESSSTEFGARQRSGSETKLGSDLVDMKVMNQQQEEIGQISDMILNIEQGRVDFVLIEPKQGSETIAVAPQAFQSVEGDQAKLNITQQDIQQAQELQASQIEQHAQQARSAGSQSPEVYTFQAGQGDVTVFGGRDTGDKKHKEEKKEKKERKMQESSSSSSEQPL